MDYNDELTLDMLGNVSEEDKQEEILDDNKTKTEEKITDDEDLFPSEEGEEIDDNLEGVSDEVQDEDDITIKSDDSKSPNFYASIAASLKGDGILNLDDSDFKDIESADDLALLFKKQVDKLLEDNHKRINEALSYDIPVDTIKQFESVLSYVDSISEDSLRLETPEAEQLRGNLIVQDYLNRGFSQERANKELKKSFESGSDVEDAIEALKEVKEFYYSKYTEAINEAKEYKEEKIKEEKEQSKKIENKFLEVEEPIKGIKLSENERKKILNQYTKFVGKDSNNRPLNSIQKYAIDNPIDYQYNINLLYYLTDGFKDLGKVIQKEVISKTKTNISNLEKILRNPSNNIGGGTVVSFENSRDKESYGRGTVVLD